MISQRSDRFAGFVLGVRIEVDTIDAINLQHPGVSGTFSSQISVLVGCLVGIGLHDIVWQRSVAVTLAASGVPVKSACLI